jgi:hypothetical protein
MRATLLPNGNLLIPVELDDPDEGAGLREIGPDHPDYSRWLALAEPGEDPRPGKGGTATTWADAGKYVTLAEITWSRSGRARRRH